MWGVVRRAIPAPLGDEAQTDEMQKVAALLQGERFGFLTTITMDGRLTSRPMALQEVEFDGDLWFFAARDVESSGAAA